MKKKLIKKKKKQKKYIYGLTCQISLTRYIRKTCHES